MGLGASFDNLSLRTKITAAMLVAVAGGLIVGVIAVTNVRAMNRDAAAAQRTSIASLSAAGALAKNIESFGGNVSALRLCPSLAATIQQNLENNRAAVEQALDDLGSSLAGAPGGPALVAKAHKDWTAYTDFIAVDRSKFTPEQLAGVTQEYNTLYGALGADQTAVQDAARAQADASIKAGQDRAAAAARTIVVVLVAGLLLSLLIGLRSARSGRSRRSSSGSTASS